VNLRQRLNDTVSRIPYIGDILTAEISPKGLATLALAVTLASPFSAKADGAVELMVGNKAHTLDVKLFGKVAKNTGLLARTRVGVDYENNSNSLTFLDLYHSLGKGFSAALVPQYTPAKGLVMMAGPQYMGRWEDLSTVVLLATSLEEKPNYNLITSTSYRPKLTSDLNFAAQLETTNIFNDRGHIFSTERARLGLAKNGFEAGVAADITHLGKEGTLDYNIGAYLKKEF
jgi:hypothetical protein